MAHAEGGDAVAQILTTLSRDVAQLSIDSHAHNITKFSGETGTRSLKDWIEDIERARLNFGGDERKAILVALASVEKKAGKFLAQYLVTNANATLANIIDALKERFKTGTERVQAQQKLRVVVQKKDELVRNFGARVSAIAKEAYAADELRTAVVQDALAEAFLKGLTSRDAQKTLIKYKQEHDDRITLDQAIEAAAQDYIAEAGLKIPCLGSAEPMSAA